MKIDVVRTAAEFEGMSAKELLAECPRYLDDPPKSRSNKSYLMGELIYRIQELSYGGLTKQTIDRLEALAENKSLKERKGDVSRLAIGTRWNGNVFFGLGKKENPRPYRRSRKIGGAK